MSHSRNRNPQIKVPDFKLTPAGRAKLFGGFFVVWVICMIIAAHG